MISVPLWAIIIMSIMSVFGILGIILFIFITILILHYEIIAKNTY